jgi:hypothetical protein
MQQSRRQSLHTFDRMDKQDLDSIGPTKEQLERWAARSPDLLAMLGPVVDRLRVPPDPPPYFGADIRPACWMLAQARDLGLPWDSEGLDRSFVQRMCHQFDWVVPEMFHRTDDVELEPDFLMCLLMAADLLERPTGRDVHATEKGATLADRPDLLWRRCAEALVAARPEAPISPRNELFLVALLYKKPERFHIVTEFQFAYADIELTNGEIDEKAAEEGFSIAVNAVIRTFRSLNMVYVDDDLCPSLTPFGEAMAIEALRAAAKLDRPPFEGAWN